MDFSLFSEGPLFRLYQSLGLVKKPLHLLHRRVLVLCLLTWLPLLFLALISRVDVNLFLKDFDVHVRFLVSLALLLYAEVMANSRFQLVVIGAYP